MQTYFFQRFNTSISVTEYTVFIHLVVCLTAGPKPLPKRALHIVRSRASSFKWEYPLLSLRSSSSFLRLLPRLSVTSSPPLQYNIAYNQQPLKGYYMAANYCCITLSHLQTQHYVSTRKIHLRIEEDFLHSQFKWYRSLKKKKLHNFPKISICCIPHNSVCIILLLVTFGISNHLT